MTCTPKAGPVLGKPEKDLLLSGCLGRQGVLLRNRVRGVSIGASLIAVALIAFVGFALAGLSVTHLHMVGRTSASQQARNLASSAVSKGIAHVLADKTFGTLNSNDEDLSIELEGSDGVGRLTFRESTASDWGIPFSVNNIEGTAAVRGGSDQSVPVAAVHLIGVGQSQGVTRVVEAVLVVPPFPYAIASSGPIRSQGGVLIAGIPEGADPTLDLDELEPADLLSNDTSDDSIHLGADTTVSGDVHSAGGIVLDDPSIKVLGEVRTQASPESIPQISADDYDPALLGMDFTPLTQGSFGAGNSTSGDPHTALLAGTLRSSGPLTFENGLTLDGATLFVDGDLTIREGLEGSGVIIVKGQTSISGGASLDTENQVAVLSEKDIVLAGHGPMSSRFQGLLYTDGALRAEQVSLVGTLVARGDEGVTLSETYVYQEKKQTTSVETTTSNNGQDRQSNIWDWDLVYQSTGFGTDANGGMAYGNGGGFYLDVPADGSNPMIQVRFEPGNGYVWVANGVQSRYYTSGEQDQFAQDLAKQLQASMTTLINQQAPNQLMAQTTLLTASLGLAQSIVQQIHIGIDTGNTTTTTSVVDEHFENLLSLGPSQFLKAEERIRLALWRER